MNVIEDRLWDVPDDVKELLKTGAWLVGSGATYLVGLTDREPNDWDVLVPYELWPSVRQFIPKGAQANRFAGFKVKVSDPEDLVNTTMDVWPDDLGRYATQVPKDKLPQHCVHLNSGVVVVVNK